MIIFTQKVQVNPSGRQGKWKRGSIPLPSDVMHQIGWKNQNIVVVLFKEDETVDLEIILQEFERFRKMSEKIDLEQIKNEIEELKKDDEMVEIKDCEISFQEDG